MAEVKTAQQPTAVTRCPRCGEPLPASPFAEVLPAPPDRHPVWRVQHRRSNGRTCVVYLGPSREEAAGA